MGAPLILGTAGNAACDNKGSTMKISSCYFVEVSQVRRAMLKKLSGGPQSFQRRVRSPSQYTAKQKLLVKLIKYENHSDYNRLLWEGK